MSKSLSNTSSTLLLCPQRHELYLIISNLSISNPTDRDEIRKIRLAENCMKAWFNQQFLSYFISFHWITSLEGLEQWMNLTNETKTLKQHTSTATVKVFGGDWSK